VKWPAGSMLHDLLKPPSCTSYLVLLTRAFEVFKI